MYLSVTLLYGAMIFVSSSTFGLLIVFVVEFFGEFVVLVFDPGGNRHQIDSELNFTSELNLASGTPSDTSLFLIQLQTFASIIYYWISL
jgi:hypothetical protein